MEQNINRDEFEQMLRDTTDDFRMYPSRKVWHSIYNDLHPDRKWPSLAVCLLLLTAILYIGVSNNNNISKTKNFSLSKAKQANLPTATMVSDKSGDIVKPSNNASGINNKVSLSFLNTTLENYTFKHSILESDVNTKNEKKDNNAINFNNNGIPVNDKNQETTEQEIANNTTLDSKIIIKDSYSNNEEGAPMKNILTGANTDSKISDKQKTTSSKVNEKVIVKKSNSNIEEKVWMEDYAFHNTYSRNKWKTNLSVEYYITPSVGYRQLYKNNDFAPASGLLQRTTENNEILNQQAAFNFEAGSSLLLKVNKRLRLKAGLQFNYTSYITNAHHLDHPTQTTVLMNDLQSGNLMPVDYNSFYGNMYGSNVDQINNYTLQLSAPLGLDYKLMGSNKIKWYVGASIQPTYVFDGNAYLISSNNKNFASDPSMLRDWNFNTSIESFISIKAPGDIFVNVGPQLRYQLLSTYYNQYSYTEKLYNIGLKLGITKKL